MFERYTETARRSIFFARYEASTFGSPAIESEHLLLGLLREIHDRPDCKLPTPETLRKIVEQRRARGPKISTSVDLPLSQECTRILAYGDEEAQRSNHGHIAPEHLLLGLLREPSCFGAQLLREDKDVTLSQLWFDLRLWAGTSQASPGQIEGSGAESVSMLALRACPRVHQGARQAAFECGAQCIETTHLLIGLAQQEQLTRALPPADALQEWVKQAEPPRREPVAIGNLHVTEHCKRALTFAVVEAVRLGELPNPTHVLLGLLQDSNAAIEILEAHGFTAAEVRAKLTQPPPASDPPQGRDYV